MTFARLGTLVATLAGAALMTGCVVAPVDGAYYTGDTYPTYTSGYGYGYSGGYPAYGYGGSSLIIDSSPTYVYGGGRRPYYRNDGNYYRPGYGNGSGYYNNHNNRPQGSRPSYVSPGTGSQIGRPIGNQGSSRPSFGGSRNPGYQQMKPSPQWQR